MSSLQTTLLGWVDARLAALLEAPRMWGSYEAVELQALQLFELRALIRRPEQELTDPRRVLETYAAFLRQQFPQHPQEPLFRLLEERGSPVGIEEGLRTYLEDFRRELDRATLPENPFEHSSLAIKLTFEASRAPSTAAFTGYYEEFRRATRAALRSGKAAGRSKKEVELATDFALLDAVVSPANGAPAEVLLRLGPQRGQADFDAEARVRDVLSSFLTVAEWAATDASVDELRVDDVGARTQTAVQALRLLPPRGVDRVDIGGTLVSRPKPVEIRGRLEARFVEIVGAEAPAEPFDETDEIRAIDLDRGSIVLGRTKRVRCFVRPEMLGELSSVGGRATSSS